jgi:leucine-rich repeat transmembrane protein FLRT
MEGGTLLEDPLATGRPGSDSTVPLFLEEPEDAYVVKSKAGTLSCRAAHALQLYFVCNGEAVRTKHHSAHEFVDPMTGIRQLEVKVDITRNDVEEYFGLDGYGCECIAWSSFGQVKSRRAKVIVACESPPFVFLLFFFCCCFLSTLLPANYHHETRPQKHLVLFFSQFSVFSFRFSRTCFYGSDATDDG